MEAVPFVAPTPLPDTFSRGTTLEGPDGLFHALAQALNNHFNTNEFNKFTVKSLRNMCYEYVNDEDRNPWIVALFDDEHGADFIHYAENVRNTTPGSIDLDATIISKELRINIHLADFIQDSRSLLTPDGDIQVLDPSRVDWNMPNTIHINIHGNNFSALLKQQAEPLPGMHRDDRRPPSPTHKPRPPVQEEVYPAATRQSHGSLFNALAIGIQRPEEEIRFQCYDYMRNLDEETFDLMQQISVTASYINKRTRDWGAGGRFASGRLLDEISGKYKDSYKAEFSKKLNWIKDQLGEDYLDYPDDISSNPNYDGRLNVDGVIFCTVFNKRLIIRELNDQDETTKTTVITKDGCIEHVLDVEKFRGANTITLQVKNGQYKFVNRNVGSAIMEYAQTVDEESEFEDFIGKSEPPIFVEAVTEKELKESKTLFEDNKPSGFVVAPQADGDAFLTPLAHGLNNIIHGTTIVTKGALEHSEASLRTLLRDFADPLREGQGKKHRIIAINNSTRENGHTHYRENIERTKVESSEEQIRNGSYIPGDFERDGPALSEQLGVDIHIMVTRDVTDKNGKIHKIIVKHLLCNKDGCREVAIDDINWKSEKVVTLVTDEKMEKFDPVDSYLPRTAEFKWINGVVHIFMGGVLLYALIPQGMAGFVVAFAMPNASWLSNPFTSSLVMAGSIVGKFGLFMSWNVKQWGGFPSAYNNIAHFLYNISPNFKNFFNSVDEGTWTWEDDVLPFTAKVFMGSVVASFFGLLAIPTNASFSADIINNPGIFGTGFQNFAAFSQNQGALISFIFASALGNFFSGPGMFGAATGAAESLYKDFQKAKANPDPHALKRFWVGAGVGGILAVAGCVGFINFGPLAVNTIYQPLFATGPFNIAVGSIYTAGIVTALFSIAFASGMPLGRKITERLMDIFKGEDIPYDPEDNYKGFWAWWTETSTAQKARFWTAAGIALLMVVVGGTPNVYQALYEHEGAILAIFALIASALAEYQGTEELVETLLAKAAEFGSWCNAQRKGAPQKPEKSFAENSQHHAMFSQSPPPRVDDDRYSVPLEQTTDDEIEGSGVTAAQRAAVANIGRGFYYNNSSSGSGDESSSDEKFVVAPRRTGPSMRPSGVIDL